VEAICRGLQQKVLAAGKKDSLDLGPTDKQAQIQAASRITFLNSKYISQCGITTIFKTIKVT
jgi:hypothetical protein